MSLTRPQKRKSLKHKADLTQCSRRMDLPFSFFFADYFDKKYISVILIIGMQKESFNHYSQLLDSAARRVKQYAQMQFNLGNYEVTVDKLTVLKYLNKVENIMKQVIAKLCAKDQTTLTRIIDILVKKGFVERVIHEQDRRSFIVTLSPKGNAKVNELEPHIREIRMKAWENLNEDDFEQLQRILNTIYRNLELNKND